MNRDQYAKQFVQDAKSRGKSKEEIEQKYIDAMRLYDQKYASPEQEGISSDDVSFRSKVAGGLSKFSSIIRGSESARGGLQIGNQARQTQAQNQQDFQRAQELTAQAKLETDGAKKRQLLNQARAIMGEVGQRAANLRQTEKEVMYF